MAMSVRLSVCLSPKSMLDLHSAEGAAVVVTLLVMMYNLLPGAGTYRLMFPTVIV